LNQCWWVSGALIGGLLGSLLTFNTKGLDFVMTAMFVVIFLEQFLKEKSHLSAWIGFGAAIICLVLFGKDQFLIPTMCVILLLLTALRKPIEERSVERP
jgi:4-azaleucine resistance transporter AzlC